MDTLVNIPKGIRHLSDWKEIGNYINYDYPIILNKQVTACGATTYYLLNDDNIILCSPRKAMIQSKLKDELLQNLITLDYESSKTIDKLQYEIELKIRERLAKKQPIKILITYDSFHYIKEILLWNQWLDLFRVIIDEMQCLIKDSAFKGNTELEFMKQLQGINKVVYLSATPTPKWINDKIPLLKDIPTIKLQFDDSDIRTIHFNGCNLYKNGKKITFKQKIKEFYNYFLDNGYFFKKTINGVDYYSKELLVFISNVNEICEIIKYNNLTQNEVDVICSEFGNSKAKLKRECGLLPSKVKGKGEQKKLFTFITRAAYEGMDWYSDNASIIIFCNPNTECMTIDISTDLHQIVGRIRNSSNVFRNDVYMFCNLLPKDVSFGQHRIEKEKLTKDQLILYNNSSSWGKEKLRKKFKSDNFKTWYIEVVNDKPIISDMYMIAEEYSNAIRNEMATNNSYQVIKDYNEGDFNNELQDNNKRLINQFYQQFCIFKTFNDRLQYLCQFIESYPNLQNQLNINGEYLSYIQLLGIKACKAKLYRQDYLEPYYKQAKLQKQIQERIKNSFSVGERNTKSFFKTQIQQIYNDLGIEIKAKATDLNKVFTIKTVKINNGNHNNRQMGFEILSINI